MAIALGLIIAIIFLKYKPTYKVTLAGQEMGYVENGTELDNRIQQEVIELEVVVLALQLLRTYLCCMKQNTAVQANRGRQHSGLS